MATKDSLVPRLTDLIYGGDYNPEQWPEDVWPEDVRLMREAGVNLVSLGIFAWAKLQQKPDSYDFGWLDRIIDLLHENGISVNLATATASPPPWLIRMHPEILPQTADGTTLWHGSRRHYCPHSAAYQKYATKMAAALATHYRDHPAIVLWHVDNEYGVDMPQCFCDASAQAFRGWLKERYQTIENFNHAWGTAFWSQQYTDWEEIQPPRSAPTYPNPTQQLDWQRFSSDSWLDSFEAQTKILREITPEIPVTTNFLSLFKPIDYHKFASREDIVSNDSYPDTAEDDWMIEAGMICDLMRSVGNRKPWILMEQSPTHVNWRQRNSTKRPGVMRLGSYQAVARGADGIMFFQWRASRAGAEKFHSAMVPHVGTDSRVWREIKQLGNELANLRPLRESRVHSEVAILFDWENWWALELNSKPSSDVLFIEQVKLYYAELYRRNITVDLIHPSSDLNPYKLVIAPVSYLVDDQSSANITQYVNDGGTLVMSFFSGIVDENDHIRLGGYPAPFKAMLGLHVEEFAPYKETQVNRIQTTTGETFDCTLWADIIHLNGADSIAHFEQDYYSGNPAITHHAYGAGTSYYVGTMLNKEGISWLIQRACDAAKVRPVLENLPENVECVRRSKDGSNWLFLLNYSDEAVSIALESPGQDCLNGEAIRDSVTVAAKGVSIILQE